MVERRKILALIGAGALAGLALYVARAKAGVAPPGPAPPPEYQPAGELQLQVEVVQGYWGYPDATLVATVTVTATKGTLPIECVVKLSATNLPQTSKTVTISELNTPYTVEFTWSAPEGTTETVTAEALFKNEYGEYRAGPVTKTVEIPVAGEPPEGTISLEVTRA